MYLFLIFNKMIFDILGLNMPRFQMAGDILLFILGIQKPLGIEIGPAKTIQQKQQVLLSEYPSSV